MRRLIKTFPGLPAGAGIYELPDGSTQFFNCAPGEECVDPDALPDFEGFYEVVDKATGKIIFIESDPYFKTLKNALLAAGKDIHDIKTEDQLMHALTRKGFGDHINFYIRQKWQNRTPTSLQQSMDRALILDDHELYNKLKKRLQKRESLGIRIIK